MARRVPQPGPAHELSQGEGITIAVIHSGVDGMHPDLEGQEEAVTHRQVNVTWSRSRVA
jgi:subtilisin family serine protease